MIPHQHSLIKRLMQDAVDTLDRFRRHSFGAAFRRLTQAVIEGLNHRSVKSL